MCSTHVATWQIWPPNCTGCESASCLLGERSLLPCYRCKGHPDCTWMAEPTGSGIGLESSTTDSGERKFLSVACPHSSTSLTQFANSKVCQVPLPQSHAHWTGTTMCQQMMSFAGISSAHQWLRGPLHVHAPVLLQSGTAQQHRDLPTDCGRTLVVRL